MKRRELRIEHVARVEGHGNIEVRVRDGELEDVKFEIVESPRFFEAMLKGRYYGEAPVMTSRVCGICCVAHALTAIKGVENAMGVKVSEQTKLLRKLLTYGATIQSHILHECFLAIPDFMGAGSAIALAKDRPDVVKRALRLKKLANDMCDIIGGRSVQPISAVVGGFTRIPSVEELTEIKQRLSDAIQDLIAIAELYRSFEIPDFERKTEYIALSSDEEYAFLDGYITSTAGWRAPEEEYREKIAERVVSHSTSKHCAVDGTPFMVGALARVNINYEQLSPMAKDAARMLGLKVPCYNPFMNNVAQVVEAVHCAEKSREVIDQLLSAGLKSEEPSVETKAGRGVGATEAPRGTLYHEYTIDDNGLITSANLIIPTGQNLANIEADMREFVPYLLEKDSLDLGLGCEMLVRAYDPCISCSVHVIELATRRGRSN